MYWVLGLDAHPNPKPKFFWGLTNSECNFIHFGVEIKQKIYECRKFLGSKIFWNFLKKFFYNWIFLKCFVIFCNFKFNLFPNFQLVTNYPNQNPNSNTQKIDKDNIPIPFSLFCLVIINIFWLFLYICYFFVLSSLFFDLIKYFKNLLTLILSAFPRLQPNKREKMISRKIEFWTRHAHKNPKGLGLGLFFCFFFGVFGFWFMYLQISCKFQIR